MVLSLYITIWALLGIFQLYLHEDWIKEHVEELNFRHDKRTASASYVAFFIVFAPLLLFYLTIPMLISMLKVRLGMYFIRRKINKIFKSKGLKERV